MSCEGESWSHGQVLKAGRWPLCWTSHCNQLLRAPHAGTFPPSLPHLQPGTPSLSLESGVSHLEPAAFCFGARVHAGDVNAQAVLRSPADGEAQGPAVPQQHVHLQEGEETVSGAWRAAGTSGGGGSGLQSPLRYLKGLQSALERSGFCPALPLTH